MMQKMMQRARAENEHFFPTTQHKLNNTQNENCEETEARWTTTTEIDQRDHTVGQPVWDDTPANTKNR